MAYGISSDSLWTETLPARPTCPDGVRGSKRTSIQERSSCAGGVIGVNKPKVFTPVVLYHMPGPTGSNLMPQDRKASPRATKRYSPYFPFTKNVEEDEIKTTSDFENSETLRMRRDAVALSCDTKRIRSEISINGEQSTANKTEIDSVTQTLPSLPNSRLCPFASNCSSAISSHLFNEQLSFRRYPGVDCSLLPITANINTPDGHISTSTSSYLDSYESYNTRRCGDVYNNHSSYLHDFSFTLADFQNFLSSRQPELPSYYHHQDDTSSWLREDSVNTPIILDSSLRSLANQSENNHGHLYNSSSSSVALDILRDFNLYSKVKEALGSHSQTVTTFYPAAIPPLAAESKSFIVEAQREVMKTTVRISDDKIVRNDISTTKAGSRSHVCHCGRAFARNEELTRHQRIHSGYKPHRCHICSKYFGRKDHLSKHLKTHLHSSEKKTHLCPVPNCGQSYTRSDALARHQMNSHGIKAKPSKWRPHKSQ